VVHSSPKAQLQLSFANMVALDIENTIAEFLADSSRSSLNLAHMTTGQRKNVKKLVAQYPDLRCESYGFGAERELHLFKKGADEDAQKENAAVVKSINAVVKDLQPVELQVRNTFIHIESTNVDNRAVQSMPHGMFRQCILSEAAQKDSAEDDATCIPDFPTTPSSVSSEPEMEPIVEPSSQPLLFSIGALVVVEGLMKRPDFNGRSAVVQGWDKAAGRYDIVLASPTGCQQAKIKEENLRMVLPCPDQPR